MMKKIEALFWVMVLVAGFFGLTAMIFVHQLKIVKGWLQ